MHLPLFQRDPRPTTSSGMFNFFQPFETEVWLTFLIAYLVTAVALWIVARVTPYEKRNPKAPPVYTLTSSLWFIFSSVFRGSNITPQVRSGVTLVGFPGQHAQFSLIMLQEISTKVSPFRLFPPASSPAPGGSSPSPFSRPTPRR